MGAPHEPQTEPSTAAAATWDEDRRSAARWLGIAVGSLMFAGLFAVLIVIARTPVFDQLVGDPGFFKRCLVIHVDLALVAWFYAFLGALFFLIPTPPRPAKLARLGPSVAGFGLVMVMLGATATGAEPILSNYVPVIDDPLFVGGLLVFMAGLVLTLAQPRLLPGNEVESGFFPLPDAARPGLRAAAVAVLLAVVTFAASWQTTPTFLAKQAYYEAVIWGGGHVLQVASVAAMLAIWIVLVDAAAGRSPLSRQTAGVLFGLLVLPFFAGPVLALGGTTQGVYRGGFTTLMQFGIFPVVLVVLFACVRTLVRARRERPLLRDPRVLAFAASVALTLVGFVVGAMINGSNTLIPAHYHAAIGAVTVAFMSMTFLLFEPLGLRLTSARQRRIATWQPLVFGVGQLVFVLGFGFAGANGAGRKSFGAEQHIRTTAESLGLGVMSLGGLIAVVGGLVFLYLVTVAWRNRTAPRPAPIVAPAPTRSISPLTAPARAPSPAKLP